MSGGPGPTQSQNNSAYYKMYTITNSLDKLIQKGLSQKKKTDIVNELKNFIQDIIAENHDLKSRSDRVNNISSESGGDISSGIRIKEKNDDSAGYMIDHFGSNEEAVD